MTSVVLPDAAAVRRVREALVGQTVLTPLIALEGAAEIALKPEMLQPHGSFKIRAAIGALSLADPSTLKGGVVTASAGNFGQGLAAAARRLGVACHIAVPHESASTKVEAMRSLGAVLHPMPFADWWQVFTSRHLPTISGRFVHPVADTGVLAGNATLGLEIAEACPDVQMVVVPFGGGGLAVGVAVGLRLAGSRARVLVVESEASRQVAAALAAGRPVAVERAASFIDGMGGRGILPEMWPLVAQSVDDVVTVSLDDVAAAVALLYHRHHLVAEGAGAAALAGALAVPELGGPVVCVLSGGNIDLATLCRIIRSPHAPAS